MVDSPLQRTTCPFTGCFWSMTGWDPAHRHDELMRHQADEHGGSAWRDEASECLLPALSEVIDEAERNQCGRIRRFADVTGIPPHQLDPARFPVRRTWRVRRLVRMLVRWVLRAVAGVGV